MSILLSTKNFVYRTGRDHNLVRYGTKGRFFFKYSLSDISFPFRSCLAVTVSTEINSLRLSKNLKKLRESIPFWFKKIPNRVIRDNYQIFIIKITNTYRKKYLQDYIVKEKGFQAYVECIQKIGRNYYFDLTQVGLEYSKLKSGEFTRSWHNCQHAV